MNIKERIYWLVPLFFMIIVPISLTLEFSTLFTSGIEEGVISGFIIILGIIALIYSNYQIVKDKLGGKKFLYSFYYWLVTFFPFLLIGILSLVIPFIPELNSGDMTIYAIMILIFVLVVVAVVIFILNMLVALISLLIDRYYLSKKI